MLALVTENEDIAIYINSDYDSCKFTGKWRTDIKTKELSFEIEGTLLISFEDQMFAKFCFITWFKHMILNKKFKPYKIHTYEWFVTGQFILKEKPKYITNTCEK